MWPLQVHGQCTGKYLPIQHLDLFLPLTYSKLISHGFNLALWASCNRSWLKKSYISSEMRSGPSEFLSGPSCRLQRSGSRQCNYLDGIRTCLTIGLAPKRQREHTSFKSSAPFNLNTLRVWLTIVADNVPSRLRDLSLHQGTFVLH